MSPEELSKLVDQASALPSVDYMAARTARLVERITKYRAQQERLARLVAECEPELAQLNADLDLKLRVYAEARKAGIRVMDAAPREAKPGDVVINVPSGEAGVMSLGPKTSSTPS